MRSASVVSTMLLFPSLLFSQVFAQGGKPPFTLVCPSSWAYILCKELIKKVKEQVNGWKCQLSDQNYEDSLEVTNARSLSHKPLAHIFNFLLVDTLFSYSGYIFLVQWKDIRVLVMYTNIY